MAFTTKLKLSDDKFIQESGTTLTLSGNTIVGSGGTLRYESAPSFNDSLDIVTRQYVDEQVSSGTSGIVYTGVSPSNIEVGGMQVGTDLTGRTSTDILEEILVATFTPTFVNPSNAFSDDQANTQEVGVEIDLNFTATFNQGQILLQGVEQAKRSGLPNTYNYTGTGLPSTVASTSLIDNQNVTGYTLLEGTNTWTSSVSYDEGPQPLDSNGDNFGSPLPSGTTSAQSTTVTGIYPYFFGTVASGGAPAGSNRPTANQALIDSGTKVVASSNGTITVNYSSTSDDYIWFATPETSTTKTVWFINALNNGSIGGSVSPGGNLFPSPDVVSIDSPTVLWNGVNYKIYISNFQSAVTDPIELRNS